MISNLFGGIFDSSTVTVIPVYQFLLCVVVSLLLGIVLAAAYTYKSKYNAGFVRTLGASRQFQCPCHQYDNHIFSFHRVFLHFITICLPPSDIFLQACSCGFLIFHHDFQIPISAPQMVDHFFFL